MTLAEKILAFNQNLQIKEELPDNIRVLYPYQENPEVQKIAAAFYHKYYSDHQGRKLILGINPGRLGAGATGVPFTDPKRLKTYCGIDCSFSLHEPSSVFVHEVIQAYGGVSQFFGRYYISSVCPLGFVKIDEQGRETNFNYYDSSAMAQALTPFIVSTIRDQIDFGLETERVYCMGTGKNFKFLNALNKLYRLFGEVVPLEHPRYVMQYKSKAKSQYIDKYLKALTDTLK